MRSLTFVARRRGRGSGDGGHVAHGGPHPRRAAPLPASGVDGRGGGEIAAGARGSWIGGEGRGGGGEGG
uniref:Uncharacterized protein n=1 Tax=Arundo donax TaxID=35708 RepID=A0A0A8ZT14_ARUDO